MRIWKIMVFQVSGAPSAPSSIFMMATVGIPAAPQVMATIPEIISREAARARESPRRFLKLSLTESIGV